MKFSVNRNLTAAPYEQIKKQLREHILDGKLAEESPLPSVREIVLSTGVSLATAQRALNELKTEGLIYVKPGRGTFVAKRNSGSIKKIHIFLPSSRLSFFMEILAGIHEALENLEIETILHSLDTDKLVWDWKTIEALEAIQSEPAGVIFIEEATGAVRDICSKTAQRIPFVTVEWKLENAGAVLNDYHQSTYNAISYLVSERAAKKILVLKGRDYQHNAGEKLRGIREAAKKFNLTEQKDIFYLDTDFDAISGYNAVSQFLQKQLVDAVFCANDYEAIGAVGALNEAGLLVGKDVALIGYGDMTDKTTLYFPLTTVNQHLHDMGIASVEALLALASNEKGTGRDQEYIIPATLEIRKT
ncbi:MAG: substrate-binding domain-containing protein [Bacteroidetes bacterium]|nr:substrate-binding domain-containing protein [Bacteroidota bacterium]